MSRLYLDTEFNGFGGELMSLALVPADRALAPFYRVTRWEAPVVLWVRQHVVPVLEAAPVSRQVASADLGAFLCCFTAPVIVADWPTDFELLLALLVTGPGKMQSVPDFSMELKALPSFNSAKASRKPHNALADAQALRDYCEGLREGTR